jgi:hypothetical protein
VLVANGLEGWPSFDLFENVLQTPGPWIAGIDFPFGQSRTFVENIGWPGNWVDYATVAGSLGRAEFRATLKNYSAARPFGDKEHRRKTDIAASAISPQKLHGVPVGLMFFEGARRLVEAGVTIPGLQLGDPERIVVEAYPGALGQATDFPNQLQERQPQEADAIAVRNAPSAAGIDIGWQVGGQPWDYGQGSPQPGRRPDRRPVGCAFLRDPGGLGLDDAKRAVWRAGTARFA